MSLTCWTTLRRLRSAPPPRAPGVCGCGLLSPKEGVAAQPESCPAGWGARKLEGTGGGGLVTWANLPQGNEVSSRLLGGNGGGRIRPRLTQAGRGISPRSLQPSPLPPPPPGPLLGTGVQRRESSSPSWPSPEAGVSFRPRFPAPQRSAQCPGIARLGEGPRAGRMSPHGKQAGGQELGQPRPPPSTPRAPDRGPCELRRPLTLPGARLRGAACGWPGTRLARTHLLPPFRVFHCPHPPWLVKHRKIPGTVPGVPSLLCPLRSRGVRVASPPAAALHNRGDGACPAAARGVTLHVAGTRAVARLPASLSTPASKL